MGLAGLLAYVFFAYGDKLNKDAIADKIEVQQDWLVAWGKANPVLMPLVVYAGYAAATAVSLPAAAFLTLAIGWYFSLVYGGWGPGLVVGLLTVSFASTTGATLSFLASRYFLGDTIRKKFPGPRRQVRRQLGEGGPLLFIHAAADPGGAVLAD